MKTIMRRAVWTVALLIIAPSIQLKAQQDRVVTDDDMKVVTFEDMNYPALGRTARVQGVVVVEVKLDDQGRVVEAMAISGKQVFIPDCTANARKWRFRPNAQKAAVIVYNFRLSDGISNSGCDRFMLEPPNFATITTCPVEIQ
jgi:TonB-like protein